MLGPGPKVAGIVLAANCVEPLRALFPGSRPAGSPIIRRNSPATTAATTRGWASDYFANMSKIMSHTRLNALLKTTPETLNSKDIALGSNHFGGPPKETNYRTP